MGDIGAVFARIGSSFKQQAFVVHDLAAAKESMQRSFGCTQFFEFTMTNRWEYQGRTVQCDLALAFGRSGNTMIELMQPLAGEGVIVDFLAQRGPGVHHLGFFVDRFAEIAAEAAALGYPPVMSGSTPMSSYCFLDTLDELGVYLELIEDPQGMMMRMMPWWDAATPGR